MKRITAALAQIPLTLPDVLVVGGFGAVIKGLWMTFGAGPTWIAGGAAMFWVGISLYRAKQG
jgi:hypothetical protein